jgi:hypothetical protein
VKLWRGGGCLVPVIDESLLGEPTREQVVNVVRPFCDETIERPECREGDAHQEQSEEPLGNRGPD